eukprot:g2363.t1
MAKSKVGKRLRGAAAAKGGGKRKKKQKAGWSSLSIAQLAIAGVLACSVFWNLYQSHGFLHAESTAASPAASAAASSRTLRGQSAPEVEVVFRNTLADSANFFWVNAKGGKTPMSTLHAGKAIKMAARVGQMFRFEVSAAGAEAKGVDCPIKDQKLNFYQLVPGTKVGEYLVKSSIAMPDELAPAVANIAPATTVVQATSATADVPNKQSQAAAATEAKAAVSTAPAVATPAKAEVEAKPKAKPKATPKVEAQVTPTPAAVTTVASPKGNAAVAAASSKTAPVAAGSKGGGTGAKAGGKAAAGSKTCGYVRYEEANAENPAGYDESTDETVVVLKGGQTRKDGVRLCEQQCTKQGEGCVGYMVNFNSNKCITKAKMVQQGGVGTWNNVVTSWKDCSIAFKEYGGSQLSQAQALALETLPSAARSGVSMVFDTGASNMNPGAVSAWSQKAATGWCLYGRYQDILMADVAGFSPAQEAHSVSVPPGDTSYDEKITWCEEQCMRFDACKAYVVDLNARKCVMKTRIDQGRKNHRASVWTGKRECCGKEPSVFANEDLERVDPIDTTGDPVVLIVGSTDGSGSRGVVNQLLSLGVDMIVNDPVQFDVGGQEFSGWPPLVNRVFADLHSGNFNLTEGFMAGAEPFQKNNPSFDLSAGPHGMLADHLLDLTATDAKAQKLAQQRLREALNVTLGQLRAFLGKLDALHRGVARSRGKATGKSEPRRTKHVLWGLKAPVSMMLLPLWYYLSPLPFARRRKLRVPPLQPEDAKLLGRFKFIHVMRDGRDIAFSANQSPVDKFFKTYYKDGKAAQRWNNGGPKAKQRRAIELWDSWNREVKAFADAHPAWRDGLKQAQLKGAGAGAGAGAEDSKGGYTVGDDGAADTRALAGAGYLVVHSERLVNPEQAIIPLRQMADFVGSSLTDDQLCCLASRQQKSYGSMDHAVGKGGVKSRYGKWKTKAKDPKFLEMLNSVGAKGLKAFGYGKDGLRAPDYGAKGKCGSPKCNFAKNTPVWREAIHIGKSEKLLCASQKPFFTADLAKKGEAPPAR